MKPEEIALIKSKHNAAIVAAAGHGKTEMIVDLVEAFDQKVLLVTHTNAGIEALTKRLKRRCIDSNRYSITTIAGFCLRWCSSYPNTARLKDIPITNRDYYPMYYDGTSAIFQNKWSREVLQRTYSCVIVDEYQDCILSQHQIFIEINKTVPVIVLGDPLQAIFGWAGHLVNWNNIGFEKIEVSTSPWRWKDTNPKLGKYLSDIRQQLEPGLYGQRVTIPLMPVEGCIKIMPTSSKYNYSLLRNVQEYEDVVFITKWKNDQEAFSRGTGGAFQNDEAQGLNELFEYAADFDKRDSQVSVLRLLSFLELCASGIKTELGSYRRNIQAGKYDFRRITKFPEFGKLINAVHEDCSNESIMAVIDWIKHERSFNLHRKELLAEMRRALTYSSENNISILDAAQRIRTVPGLQRKYPGFKMLSSRTVLSKGLEFDCVIIDLEKGMSVTDYYVALTRAKRQVIILSDKQTITLTAPSL